MTEPGIPQHLPSQMFTRAQLRRALSPDNQLYYLVEHLAFESVYSLHDDFDDGLLEHRWLSRGFVAQEDDFFGSIANVSNSDRSDDEELVESDEEPTDAYLFSRVKGWRGGRRAVVACRFRVSSTSHGKIEFGFASVPSETGLGIITSQAAPTNSGVPDYGIILINPADSATSVYLIGRGFPDSGTAVARTPGVPLRVQPTNPASVTARQEYTNTLIVSLNEQREVRAYVNGQALTPPGVTNGPRSTEDLGIWFHAGPNLSSGAPIVQIDYIHAWQERIAL